MTTRQLACEYQNYKNQITKRSSTIFEKLSEANLFSDEWFDYGYDNDIERWREYRLSKYYYFSFNLKANELIITGQAYYGRGDYEERDITLTYEQCDDLDSFIRDKRKAALTKVQELQKARKEQKIQDKINAELLEQQQYLKLKEKYENR